MNLYFVSNELFHWKSAGRENTNTERHHRRASGSWQNLHKRREKWNSRVVSEHLNPQYENTRVCSPGF